MKHRALLCPILALAVFALAACEQDPDVETDRDTLADPLGDLVALDGRLYATNHDRSGNAGSQVDLFAYEADGSPADRFDLGINHAGYLAATTDGDDLYLQARGRGQLFRATRLGELVWTRSDPFAGGERLACGVAHRADLDSFVVIYHHPGTTTYTELRYGPDFEGESSAPLAREWTTFDPEEGVRAIAWADGYLWALGLDPAGQAVIEGFADDGGATRILSLGDDSACGLGAAGGVLWIAYPDRRFESIDLTAGRR
jgi:hypothetical protein